MVQKQKRREIMQIYELKKGTRHHANYLKLINNLDKWKIAFDELAKMFDFDFNENGGIKPFLFENNVIQLYKQPLPISISKYFTNDGYLKTDNKYYKEWCLLVERLDLKNIQSVSFSELKLDKVFGKNSKMVFDYDAFNCYITTNHLLKRNEKNKEEYRIFDENYQLSEINYNDFKKVNSGKLSNKRRLNSEN